MTTRPCKVCGKPIGFIVHPRSGRSVAVDASPEGRYVPVAQSGRGDPDEPRAEYRRVWKAHQESCAGKSAA
jgi:hypothetical protein